MTNVPVNTGEGPWNSSSLNLLFNEPVCHRVAGQHHAHSARRQPDPDRRLPRRTETSSRRCELPYALSPNTTYTYNVAGVTDLNGNPTSRPPAPSPPDRASTLPTRASHPRFLRQRYDALRCANVGLGHLQRGHGPGPHQHQRDLSAPPQHRAWLSQARSHFRRVQSRDYTTMTLTPTTPLAESTIYDIYYYPNPWWLTDIAGNNSTTNYGVLATFTTGTAAAGERRLRHGQRRRRSPPPPTNLCSAGTASPVTTLANPAPGPGAATASTAAPTPPARPRLRELRRA